MLVMHTRTWCVIVPLSLERVSCGVGLLALGSGISSYLADMRIHLSFFRVVSHFLVPRSLELFFFDVATSSPCLFVCPFFLFDARYSAVAVWHCLHAFQDLAGFVRRSEYRHRHSRLFTRIGFESEAVFLAYEHSGPVGSGLSVSSTS